MRMRVFQNVETFFSMFLFLLIQGLPSVIDAFSSAVIMKRSSSSSSFGSIKSIAGFQHRSATSTQTYNMIPPEWSSIILSVDVFDGSSIVDPVVVSNSFWGALQRQMLSVILGQLLAGVVFTVLATFFASQISNIRDYIIGNFFSSNDGNPSKNDFIKAGDPRIKTNYDRPAPDFGKLLICLAIDFVGTSSELIPIIGELSDIITAPIAATVLQNLFGGSKVLFFFEFAEEILPFTE